MNKYKRVFLLKIPYTPFKQNEEEKENFRTKAPFRPSPSLALAALCSFIEKYKTLDYELQAVDVNIEAYREPGVPIDVSLYPELLEDAIKNHAYDVIGISSPFVYNIKWLERALDLSRKYHPHAKVIVGGGYPTLFPEKCLNDHGVDDVVIGEGEATFLHLLNKYNEYSDPDFEARFPFESYGTRNEKGDVVVRRERTSFLQGEDIVPAGWEYLDIEKYFQNSGDRKLPIEACRGCPYMCTYCCTYLSWGRKVRYKNVDAFIEEIKQTYQKFKPEMLVFGDDNISFSKEWFKDFLNKFIALKLPMKINASNYSVKHLNEEIVDLLIKAGIERFGIAVETGSVEMQKQINKRLNLDKVREIVSLLKSKKCKIHICWMVGFPGETLEQIQQTFNFARELRANSNQFLTVLPYPGTKLYKEASDANLLQFDAENLDHFDNRSCDYLKSDEWTYDQLQDMIYDINIEINFLNNGLMETEEGREYLLGFFKNLLLRLPEHVIARIIVGYLLRNKNKEKECLEYYHSALEYLKEDSIKDAFEKYLSWDHPIIADFNIFKREQETQSCQEGTAV